MKSPTSSPLLTHLCLSLVLALGIASGSMAADAAADAAAAAAEAAAASALPEILLNSQSVTLPSANAILVRTAMTPSEVDLHLPMDMRRTVCVQYAQVPRTGQNGAQCGYDHLVQRVCRDVPQDCGIDPRTNRPRHCRPRRECYNEMIEIARVCTWLETQCVATEIATSTEMRKLKLKFKRVAGLANGEVETFQLSGAQNHLDGSDAKFSLSPISTKRAVKISAKDGVFTGFKDVITIKGD